MRRLTRSHTTHACRETGTITQAGQFRRLKGLLFAFLLAAFVAFPGLASAQQLSATLSGTVTDTTGAVIPGATITVTQTATSAVRTVQSDGSGNYVVTTLPAGNYTMNITANGFESYVAKNLVLQVAEKRGLDVKLKAGAASTTVTVEAAAITVNTESSSQAGTITGQQIRELELANRNFQQLVTLQPGVINKMDDETNAANTAMSVNGARQTANNWTIDGADINDSGSNGTVINAPNVDAIQEFTLARGNYDAGYGRSGGGQVLVATKAGTSSFHGNAYEFARNTMFDANDYFTKRSQIANGEENKNPVNHHNVYGYTIGGPVFIPHFYNTDKKKTFFFWSEEWRKQSTPGGDSMLAASQFNLGGGFNIAHTTDTNGNTVPATLPNNWTAEQIANCVSGWTVDSNGDGSGQIRSSCYGQNTQVYLTNLFSKYPANDGANYTFGYSAQNNFRDDIVRIDHYFNDKIHFYTRYMNDDMPVDNPEGLWAGSNYPGLVDTLVNSPGKNVVGNLTWTINPKVVNEFEFVWSQGTYFSAIKEGQFATSTDVNSGLTNQWEPDPYGKVPSISFRLSGPTGFSAGSSPWNERNLDRTYFDNLALTLGKHTLRTGFLIQQMLKTENAVNGTPGFTFNTWGDFLLGNLYSFGQTLPDIIPDLHFVNGEVYVQDDWKISHRLTLNLGLRWSRLPSVTDVKNTLSNFDPTVYSASLAPQIDPATGNFVADQYINGTELVPSTYTNGIIFPKGEACSAAQAISPFVTCSRFGKYVNPNYNANFAPRLGFAYDLFGNGKTVVRGGFGIFYDRLLNGIWEQNAFANPPLAHSTTINNVPFDNITSGSAAVSLGPNGITATGTPAFKIPNYAQYNLSFQHQLLPSTVVEVAYVGSQARHLLGQFDENQPRVGDRLANPDVDVNYLRPYKGYGKINSRFPAFTSNYNSLQISANHHSHGLNLGIAYTWSKTLATQSTDRGDTATNSYDFKGDYGPTSFNTPQVFSANAVYDLPFFREQHGFTGRVLGGWEVSGILAATSGSNFSVTQGADPFDTGNRGIGTGGVRVDQIAKVTKSKDFAHWFSTDSFAPAVGHFGNEGANSILGPGFQNWDLAGIKNFRIWESINFQFRAEFFNAFNHVNPNNPDAGINDGDSFGTINGGHAPRRIQFGGKINF